MSSSQEHKGPIRRFPAGFWTSFNIWWHSEYQRTQARPTSKAISRWHAEHSMRVWGDAAVCLAETQRHANRMKPRRSAAAVAYTRRDSFDGEDVDEECGVASGAAFDAAQGTVAMQAVDSAADDAVCGALDTDVTASKAAAAAATMEELNTSCLPGGIANLMNADSDVPAPAAAAGTVIAGVGAGGSYARNVPSRALPQHYSANGIAAVAASTAVGASSAPLAIGTADLQQRWMQPDPVHSGLHGGESYTPHATNGGVAGAAAVSAMGQWDSSYSLNTINQQQPCSSHAHEASAGAGGVPAFPAEAHTQHGGKVAAGLKRGFDESGCCGTEAVSGPAMQRMRGSNVPGADLVGAASSSNTGSAASAAWMRRADRELNDLMRDMGMMVEEDGCDLAVGSAGASMRSLAPLRLPDPRPQRDLSSLLLLRGQAGHTAAGPLEQKLQQHVPRQMPSQWQELQQPIHMQMPTVRCAPGGGGWQLQRGASVGGYEIEALDSVPLEALL